MVFSNCRILHVVLQHFLAFRGRAGQPGPRAENREWGHKHAPRISPVRDSNPDPVYPRAAAGTSPLVAGPTALHAEAAYTGGHSLEKPGKLTRSSHLLPRPNRPSDRQATSAY